MNISLIHNILCVGAKVLCRDFSGNILVEQRSYTLNSAHRIIRKVPRQKLTSIDIGTNHLYIRDIQTSMPENIKSCRGTLDAITVILGSIIACNISNKCFCGVLM